MKRLVFILCVIGSNYVLAMRYARPSMQPIAHTVSQRRIVPAQRLYTILRPGKYSSQLAYCPIFEKEYFTLSHLKYSNPSFFIEAALLQHIMVDQRSRIVARSSNYYEQAYKILHKMVMQKSKYDYSGAYTFEEKRSLYLLLKHVRWDETIEESKDYPDARTFAILLNEKEVALRVSAMYDSRKSYCTELDALFLSGDCEKDSEHHAKIMKEYALLFEGKL